MDGSAALIAAAVAGDERAFAAIVAAHHEDMRRVCVVVIGDDAIADEAVASAWTIAWRKLGGLHDPDRLRPWLVSIAVNEARQLVRARRRRAVLELPISDGAEHLGEPDPHTTIDLIDLRNALARLNLDDRALLAMRYLAGFQANELAAAIGRSPSGTRARLARLLQRLERDLRDG